MLVAVMLFLILGITIYYPSIYGYKANYNAPVFKLSIQTSAFRPSFTATSNFRIPSISVVRYPRFGYPMCNGWDC